MGRPRALTEHGDQGWGELEQGTAFLVAISPRGPMQDGAGDFEGAVDGGCPHALGEPCLDQRTKGVVVDLAYVEMARVLQEQPNVPGDLRGRAFALRFEEESLRAVGEERSRVLTLFDR